MVYLRELKENAEKGNWPDKLETLLQEFRDVFSDKLPKELPPQQERLDHRIDLKVGSEELYTRNPYQLSQQERGNPKKENHGAHRDGTYTTFNQPLGSPCTLCKKERWDTTHVH